MTAWERNCDPQDTPGFRCGHHWIFHDLPTPLTMRVERTPAPIPPPTMRRGKVCARCGQMAL